MARRKRVYRKIERRDPRYDSSLVGKLISKVMLDGKRSLAERIVYAAIDMANEGTDSIDPLEVITRAIENAKPLLNRNPVAAPHLPLNLIIVLDLHDLIALPEQHTILLMLLFSGIRRI